MEKLPAYDCHCHILPGLDDGLYTHLGTNTHNQNYTDAFDIILG